MLGIRGIRLLLLLAAALFSPGLQSQYSTDRTDWLYRGQVGLSTHYVANNPRTLETLARQFDVDTVASQASSVGASWFMFTVHHQPWIMLAPNATFDRIVGSGAYTSERDLPLDLHKALGTKNIRLLLYVNMRMDPASPAPAAVRSAMGGWPPNDQLIGNMAAVWREFSLRYGTRIAGWWIDAAGVPAYRNSPHRERWFKMISAALRAGNPDAIIAFNSGVRMERFSQSDYSAGEMEELNFFPRERWIDGAQWHAFTFLGGWWGSGNTRFSTQELVEYSKKVVSKGGALTFDVGTHGLVWETRHSLPSSSFRPGYIDPVQVDQLREVIRSVRN